MNKLISRTAILLIFLQLGTELNAQICWLAKDSVFQGSDSSAFVVYNYVGSQLTAIHYTDSGQTTVQTTDSIFYGSNGKQSSLKVYDPISSSPFRVSTLTYDSNDRISRVHVMEDYGFGVSTLAHDIIYNASNEIISMKVDPSSITGSPDVFDLNFENMVWLNGNVKSLSLIGDLIGLGTDTLEFTVEYDTKLNLGRLLPIEEVGGLIEQISGNNITKLITVNDEVVGPAGTLGLDRVYTYDGNDEVSSIQENLALFNEEERTTGYKFQCSGIGIEENEFSSVSIFPQPAKEELHIKTTETINSISLYSLTGQLVLKTELKSVTDYSLSLNGINSGVYVLEILGDQKTHRAKILVD